MALIQRPRKATAGVSSIKGMTLNSHQCWQLGVARMLADLGLDVGIINGGSETRNGVTYYKGANGSYENGKILIDINAGRYSTFNNKSGILKTASHELTHFIQDYSPAVYQELKDFAFDLLGKSEGYDGFQALVDAKLARDTTGKLTVTEAEDEVLADACEMMLRDSTVLQDLFENHKTLGEKILEFIAKLFGGFRELYGEAAFTESKAFEALSPELRQRLQEMWDKGLTDASQALKEIGATKNTANEGGEKFSLKGVTKDGLRVYETDVDQSLSFQEKQKLYRNRIATIINLGGVKLNTDVKKLEIRGDFFTGTKNAYGDQGSGLDMEAKLNALYDTADILATSKYDPSKTEIEPSYKDPSIEPKNTAHKDVKYWYKFKNRVILDGYVYDTVFNIRDKGKEQYQYVIEFHGLGPATKKQMSSVKDTAGYDTDLASLRRTSDEIKISQDKGKVKKKNSDRDFAQMTSEERAAVVYNKTVVLKEQTVDKYLADYASKSSPNYAQAYIVKMKPDDFVKLTSSKAGRDIIAKQTGKLDVGELAESTVQQPFQLRIDTGTGEINGHEGRHRATALAREGIRSIPVLLFDSSNKYSKTALESIKLKGQDFGNSRSDAVVTVNDVQPLSYSNRNNVISKFATQPGMERIAENYGWKETVRYSLKDTAQMTEEERKAEEKQLRDQIAADSSTFNESMQKYQSLKSSEEFGRYMDAFAERKDGIVEAYGKWAKESGLDDAYKQMNDAKDRMDRNRKQLDKIVNERLQAEEKAEIEKSGLSESEYFQKQAVKEFGYTPYFYDAGYILPNGKMLNFSGEKGRHFGTRGKDHRAIGMIYAGDSGSDAMIRFMNDGNVRIMAESPGLDISNQKELTRDQLSTIRRFVNQVSGEEYFNLDFSDERGNSIGSIEYEGRIRADRIINDIQHFFQTGEVRQPSGLSQFYSERDASQMTEEEILAFADESVAKNEEERRLLREYKAKVGRITELEAKLAQVERELKPSNRELNTRGIVGVTKGIMKELGVTDANKRGAARMPADPGPGEPASGIFNRTASCRDHNSTAVGPVFCRAGEFF